MAEVRRQRRQTSAGRGYNTRAYVEGNTVRKIQTVPETKPQENAQVSHSARRNRERALNMSPGFVLFLAAAGVAILLCCVSYIQTKSAITSKAQTVAALETEYSQLKADNDAYYSQVSTSVDMETVKAIAIKRLGMRYATDDQLMTYQTERSSYVRQYQDVPEAK